MSDKISVLIVDDEPKNIQVLGKVLVDDGYNVVVANNGAAAIDKLEKFVPDVILLDIMMPVMDGIEACKKIKQNKQTSNIPVIFLSAKSEIDDIVEGFRAGAVDYVTKPFNKEELLCRVSTHAELVRRKRELAEQLEQNNQLLHIICHDLVNPIGNVSTIIDFLEEDEVIGEYKELLGKSVDSALNVIDMVRKYRAAECGKHKASMESVNLLTAVANSLQILNSMLNKKQVNVDLDVSSDIYVLADRVMLENSVISNIITNAVKFSESGSNIEIEACLVDGKVVLSFRDYGVGIPDNLLSKIFDPLEATTRRGTDNEKGTGFGLPIVKKSVEAMSGSISIESSDSGLERGTKVTITLISD